MLTEKEKADLILNEALYLFGGIAINTENAVCTKNLGGFVDSLMSQYEYATVFEDEKQVFELFE